MIFICLKINISYIYFDPKHIFAVDLARIWLVVWTWTLKLTVSGKRIFIMFYITILNTFVECMITLWRPPDLFLTWNKTNSELFYCKNYTFLLKDVSKNKNVYSGYPKTITLLFLHYIVWHKKVLRNGTINRTVNVKLD